MNSANGDRPRGPFAGVLVIDLTRVLAGPFSTMLMADLGARVIKVEQPGSGDDSRAYGPFKDGKSVYFNFVNRGKESIALDLKDERDRALFLKMVERADVLVENFRPGTMEKLGFSYAELSKLNPRLVYASGSGFGQTGPMSRTPAYDTVVQALSGIMSITGDPEGPPTRVGTSVADLTAGVYLFGGIASALYAREQSGRGAHVDVAMLDGMISYLLHGVMEFVAHGRTLGRLGNSHPSIAPFDTYQAADEMFVICAGGNEVFVRLCDAIGRGDIPRDMRFAQNRDRHEHQHALRAELETTLKTQPARHWVEVLTAAGVPCARIQSIPEAIAMEQVKARKMMVESDGLQIIGNPIKIGGFDDPATRAAAPALDAQGEKIRAEFGAAGSGASAARR